MKSLHPRHDLRCPAAQAVWDRGPCACGADDVPRLQAHVHRLAAALIEIARGAGAYHHDPLVHAGNCITDMKACAANALAEIGPLPSPPEGESHV